MLVQIFLSALFVASFETARAASFECGQAQALSGASCPHPRIKVDLSGCPFHQDKKKWTITGTCESGTASFRHEGKGFQFSGQLQLKDSGWDTPSWSTAAVRYTHLGRKAASEESGAATPQPVATPAAASEPANQAPPAVKAEVAPAVPAAAVPSAAPPSGPSWKTNGFVEVKYRGVQQPDGPSRQSESGFLVDDAALYLEGKLPHARLFIDLPFSRDRQTTGNNPDFGKSDSADFGFAKTKAQAFIEIPSGPNSLFQFGQFDTIYGFELNDSKDRFFSQTGLVYNNALPVTHTGALWQYSRDGLALKLLVANPNNKGSLGTSTASENGLESGLTLGWSNAWARVLLGYLGRPKANPAGELQHRTLKNAVIGFSGGGFDLDFEYDVVFDPSKDANGDLNSDEEGKGMLVHLVYTLNDHWKLGLRNEQTQKDLLSGGNFEESARFIGLLYRQDEFLSFGAEYGAYEITPTENAEKKKSSLASASVRFQF